MILLDSNVISESFRPSRNLAVRDWFDAQAPESLFICSPVLAEIRFGIERLAPGVQRSWLGQETDRLEHLQFRGRVLPFDAVAASIYGRIAAERQRKGKPISPMDGLIAAIAIAHGAAIATRDSYGFADLGLTLIDPFDFRSQDSQD